jgi:hypothetical protein
MLFLAAASTAVMTNMFSSSKIHRLKIKAVHKKMNSIYILEK